MNIDFYTFIQRFFDEHPKKVEVIFFDSHTGAYRGTIWVRRRDSELQYMNKSYKYLRWSTLSKGDYKVDGIQSPRIVGQPNYRIKISYNQKRVRF